MKPYKLLVWLLPTVALALALNTPIMHLPPLGAFLSPQEGFWRNEETSGQTELATPLAGNLTQPVDVTVDSAQVCHIFAKNNHDLYFMQGYLTARDRLWQMEFQALAAAGRLAEIVGDGVLEMDLSQRRTGLTKSAELTMRQLSRNPEAMAELEAYASGVNAYIATLRKCDLPVEYKLLDYQPEPWTPIKSVLLMKQMALMLCGESDDLRMTNIMKKVGLAQTENLFPNRPYQDSPIIVGPQERTQPPIRVAQGKNKAWDALVSTRSEPERVAGLGSNNWVVGGSKTQNGKPILANDPHLYLGLPSVWYEVQLVNPTNKLNVYGVSLPGIPYVIIGFNQSAAWGVTNAEADVADWYKIEFNDARKTAYRYGGGWRPVERRVEAIRVRGGGMVYDTVCYTHHGPVRQYEGEPTTATSGYAFRWVGHEPSADLLCFKHLNTAANLTDFQHALSGYGSPAMNFIFASSQNDIAIWVNGQFPLRWAGQGKYLLDGSDPSHDWQGFIPFDQNPHQKNPGKGYLFSANQSPVDQSYPYYLSWQYAPSERARRLDQRLRQMNHVTIDSMQRLQTDVFNVRAYDVLPLLLNQLDAGALSPQQRKAYDMLTKWSYQNTTNAVEPAIFQEWMWRFTDAVWKDEFAGEGTQAMRYPSFDRTLHMIRHEPTSPWFDNQTTPKTRETLTDAARLSFSMAIDSMVKYIGPIDEKWAWYRYKSTSIRHPIPGLDAFSRQTLKIGGGDNIINAVGKNWGPSWRMVVEVGPEPKAYGIYPGGQSGNPGSTHYDDMLPNWQTGQLRPLRYLTSAIQPSLRTFRFE
ncbi:penicillin acylase family protein [Fibrella sp. WM1]|uniref:penicillin acylase family protein n=1 Tax=Fibrella musci TaxID=3242485 RepID=UPI003520995A